MFVEEPVIGKMLSKHEGLAVRFGFSFIENGRCAFVEAAR